MSRFRLRLLPAPLSHALMLFGAFAFVFYPLDLGWTPYVLGLIFSAAYGLRVRSRRRVTVLERLETDTERVWIVRIADRRRGTERLDPSTDTDLGAVSAEPVGEPVKVARVESRAQTGGAGVTTRRLPFPRQGEPLQRDDAPAPAPASAPEMTDTF
jgi:hypothetical protein